MSSLKLTTLKNFEAQLPTKKRQVAAQYDDEHIFVYQAYNNAIANFAVEKQFFGGQFKPGRMTWVKPNFLWMMHRSGWARKANQERVLAIQLRRSFFEELLSQAVLSSYKSQLYPTQENWKTQLQNSEVRIQWDPAYDIYDQKQSYRAIQIGMKGDVARQYAKQEIVQIIDVTAFAHQQQQFIQQKQLAAIQLPEEKVYTITDELKAQILAD